MRVIGSIGGEGKVGLFTYKAQRNLACTNVILNPAARHSLTLSAVSRKTAERVLVCSLFMKVKGNRKLMVFLVKHVYLLVRGMRGGGGRRGRKGKRRECLGN